MNRVFVLKDVAYATSKEGGTISGINEVTSLAPGALAFFTGRGKLITATTGVVNVADLADVKEFAIAIGRAEDIQIINCIPRQDIWNVNLAKYQEPVAVVKRLGAADDGFTFEPNSSVSIKAYDTSYTSHTNVQETIASTYVGRNVNNEAILNKLADRFNKPDSFVTATVGGTAPNFYIDITPKDARVYLELSVNTDSDFPVMSTVTESVYGAGLGKDMLQMERDASVEEGNGNYIDFTAEFYKRAMEVDASANYDGITILWEGKHSSPTRTHNVMKNRISIINVEGSTAQNATEVMTYLNAIVGMAYDDAVGEEPAEDDGTDIDGVAGN